MKAVSVLWGWQEHFMISAQLAADGVFGELDSRLAPYAFIVGIAEEDFESVGVVPADCLYAPSVFADVRDRIAELASLDPGNEIQMGDPHSRALQADSILLRGVRDAVIEKVRMASPAGREIFASMPQRVGPYLVLVVLQMDSAAVSSHYSLRTGIVEDRYPVARSLIETCLIEYGTAAETSLTMDYQGNGPRAFITSPREILRLAGQRLMVTPGWRLGLDLSLFEQCNSLAGQRLEGEEGRGKVVFAPADSTDLDRVLDFARPIPFRHPRMARKALEMTSEETLAHHAGEGGLTGLVRIPPRIDWSREDVLIAEFLGHHQWQLVHNDGILMRVSLGIPGLPQPKLLRKDFAELADRVLGSGEDVDLQGMWEVVQVAVDQRHGCLLVFGHDAQAEARRLSAQCIVVANANFDKELFDLITRIDGAVLCDCSGRIHAVGAILDGSACQGCTSARGARYNSAVRYVGGEAVARVAVVVSEDGDVELLPMLNPRIHREQIEIVLGQLKQAVTAEPRDVGAMNRALGWLDIHRFYLSAEQCERANRLRDLGQAGLNVRVIYRDFTAHPSLDDSYFFPDSNT